MADNNSIRSGYEHLTETLNHANRSQLSISSGLGSISSFHEPPAPYGVFGSYPTIISTQNLSEEQSNEGQTTLHEAVVGGSGYNIRDRGSPVTVLRSIDHGSRLSLPAGN